MPSGFSGAPCLCHLWEGLSGLEESYEPGSEDLNSNMVFRKGINRRLGFAKWAIFDYKESHDRPNQFVTGVRVL